jgi:hypothetical protein
MQHADRGRTPSVTSIHITLYTYYFIYIHTHTSLLLTQNDYTYSAKIAISAFLGAHRASSERCHRSVARSLLRTPSVRDPISSGYGNFFFYFFLFTQTAAAHLCGTPSLQVTATFFSIFIFFIVFHRSVHGSCCARRLCGTPSLQVMAIFFPLFFLLHTHSCCACRLCGTPYLQVFVLLYQ